MRFYESAAAIAVAAISLAACGGGGGGGMSTSSPPAYPTAAPTTAPTTAPTGAPTAAPQVIKIALPQGSMGSYTDPVFGTIGGYTQNTSSQVLGFVPGAQVMLQNVAPSTPHTFSVIGTAGFSAVPSMGPSGGNTIGAGFASGAINGGQLIGPFTLAQGTYYFGCAFHYVPSGSTPSMRDVIVVQPGAQPGAQATPVPQPTGTNTPYTCPGGYC